MFLKAKATCGVISVFFRIKEASTFLAVVEPAFCATAAPSQGKPHRHKSADPHQTHLNTRRLHLPPLKVEMKKETTKQKLKHFTDLLSHDLKAKMTSLHPDRAAVLAAPSVTERLPVPPLGSTFGWLNAFI